MVRIFSTKDLIEDIISHLRNFGIAAFTDMTSIFIRFYDGFLKNCLSDNYIQSYTNHETEGYYYFIYDSLRFTFMEAQKAIRNGFVNII